MNPQSVNDLVAIRSGQVAALELIMIIADDSEVNLSQVKTILVVEDEAPIRLLTLHILNQAGYRTVPACDGIDALRHLESATAIDLMITDLSMPGINGVELARRARLLRPGLPVIFATGSLDCFPDVVEIPSLSKPFGCEELIAAVERALVSFEFSSTLSL